MKRIAIVGLLFAATAITWQTSQISAQAPAATAAQVTFTKDALPILQKNCQSCHRPGEVAPMSFLTYQNVRPYARAIKNAVTNRVMPPWFAEDGYSHLSNDRRLKQADIDKLVAWVDQGAVEGDPKDAPAPLHFEDGWQIKPDMVIEMPLDVKLPATGTINYQNVLVKVNFPEDRWVIAAEMRPGNRKAVHHMRANLRPPTSQYMRDVEPGIAYENGDKRLGNAGGTTDLIGKFNPGLGDQVFNEFDSAKFIPKGSDIIFNLHYTATGEETTDRSKVGLVFAPKGWTPKYRYFVHNGPLANNLAIPPFDANAEVVAELTAQVPLKLVYLQPHMHLRGKDFEFRVVYPSGEMKTVLKGKWDFNWHLGYDLAEPLDIPVGSRLISICHYDNSAANKSNPDPSKKVLWGDQNWDEMQNIFIGVLVDPSLDQRTFFKASGPSLLPRGDSGPRLSALLLPPGTK
jgi:mono/diheme cytochrome c family protein